MKPPLPNEWWKSNEKTFDGSQPGDFRVEIVEKVGAV